MKVLETVFYLVFLGVAIIAFIVLIQSSRKGEQRAKQRDEEWKKAVDEGKINIINVQVPAEITE